MVSIYLLTEWVILGREWGGSWQKMVDNSGIHHLIPANITPLEEASLGPELSIKKQLIKSEI